MKKLIFIVISLLIFTNINATPWSKNKDNLAKINLFILSNNLDSARILLPSLKINTNSEYTLFLKKILNSNTAMSYNDLFIFTEQIMSNSDYNTELQIFLSKNLHEPQNTSVIDIDFVKAKWLQISFLTDAVLMGEAQTEYENLDKYITQFNKTDLNYLRADFYKNTYSIVLELIKQDIDKGAELCLKNKAIASELNDTTLMIISNYYYLDMLMLKGDLNGYIELTEKNIFLDKKLKKRTSYYLGNLCKLTDAYLYKGDSDDKVYELLDEIYNKSKEISFSYYIQYVGNLADNDSKTKEIYNRFGVDNLLSLCDTVSIQAKGKLVPNEYYQLLRLNALTLFKKKHYIEAFNRQNESIGLIKKIYSVDLSEALSKNKILRFEDKKNYEIAIVEERSKLYVYILILLIIMIFGTIVSMYIQFKNNLKLKELSYFKNDMLGMIVHDLKNPLNTIVNIDTTSVTKREFTRVKNTGKQMLNLVLNILELSKYESAKINLKKKSVSLKSILNPALDDVKYLAHQKNINIKNEIDSQIYLLVDKGIIKRVFINLLANAIKYSEQNKEVIISTEKLEGNKIKITVTDYGEGIPKEYLNQVFHKFRQVNAKKSGSVISTGLGLAFCKMAVESHKGKIGVSSILGKGSSFWIILSFTEGEFITSEEVLEIETNSTELVLSDEEKELLYPYITQLKELNIFAVTDVENIIKDIKRHNIPNLTAWAEQIEICIETYNKEKYTKLVNS